MLSVPDVSAIVDAATATRGRTTATRLSRLYIGLIAFGASLGLMVRAGLGLGPWDVLHQGIARHLGVQIGWITIAVSALVLLAWIPLRQRPGLGTVSNVVLVGLTENATLDLVHPGSGLTARIALLTGGILLNALATGLYIGAHYGPGPRDGLMTGLAARGASIRVGRTLIELSALGAGFALGGSVGVGTVVYALGIGPLVHWTMPRLAVRR